MKQMKKKRFQYRKERVQTEGEITIKVEESKEKAIMQQQ